MKIAVVCKQTADKRRNPHFVIGNLEKQLEAITKAKGLWKKTDSYSEQISEERKIKGGKKMKFHFAGIFKETLQLKRKNIQNVNNSKTCLQ